MLTAESIRLRAQRSGICIGLGVGMDVEKAKRAKMEAEDSGFADVVLYNDARKLAEDLLNERIDAAVRGDLDSNHAMGAIRKTFQVTKVLRAAFMQPCEGRMFLLAPVGIDEGWTIAEKVEIARLSTRLMRRLDIEPEIGFMSGGRASDKGRMAEIDRSIEAAEAATEIATSEGIRARDFQVLIENAANECDVIIAPDGISGNLIFRTLHFLGGAVALGAPVLNIDSVYIDTSRAKTSYGDSIALASALASMY
ncbi:MAG: methanogenesis marker protein Mmp4/MtxX [Euryarchaeota archaeon]|mgnify:CR=1 FL=1|nr:methanogenesis marker protein Mmp4/MtxX [Euryarchaeota archaeon]